MNARTNFARSHQVRRAFAVGLAFGVVVLGVVVSRAQISGGTIGATDSVPEVLAYRGYLEQDGVPLETGTGTAPSFRFTAYADSVARWSEVHASVPVHAGHFEVALGSQTPFTAATPLPDMRPMFQHPNVMLGIEVDVTGAGTNWVPLNGRQRFPVAPYTMTARQAERFAATGDVTLTKPTTVQGTFTTNGALTFIGTSSAASVTAGSFANTGSSGVSPVSGVARANHFSNVQSITLFTQVDPPGDGSTATDTSTTWTVPSSHTSFCVLGEFRRGAVVGISGTPTSECSIASAVSGTNRVWTLTGTAKAVTAYCRMNCIDIP